MILIPLKSINSPLSQFVSLRFSPLHEMAASLHTLAQIEPPEPLAEWAKEVLKNFHTERLIKEWEYFEPLFRYDIPDVLNSIQTRGVKTIADQYAYLAELKTKAFSRSTEPVLQAWSLHHGKTAIAEDVQTDPDYVKGRLSLFLSSYGQLFFQDAWERVAPLFIEEAGRIQAACTDISSLSAFLQDICPSLSDVDDQHMLSFATSGPGQEAEAEQLILYPSYFYRSKPFLFQKGTSVHMQYSLK